MEARKLEDHSSATRPKMTLNKNIRQNDGRSHHCRATFHSAATYGILPIKATATNRKKIKRIPQNKKYFLKSEIFNLKKINHRCVFRRTSSLLDTLFLSQFLNLKAIIIHTLLFRKLNR
jgi:hypothetical protein